MEGGKIRTLHQYFDLLTILRRSGQRRNRGRKGQLGQIGSPRKMLSGRLSLVFCLFVTLHSTLKVSESLRASLVSQPSCFRLNRTRQTAGVVGIGLKRGSVLVGMFSAILERARIQGVLEKPASMYPTLRGK